MKAWIKIAIVCLMGNAPLVAQTTGENTAANGGKQLTILHTSDMHSRVLPIPAGAADEYAGRGGLVRRASCVEQERLQDPELLLLDCGDFSKGSPYYNLFKGEVEVKMMNRMKYDAVTIGNHEFDFGLDNLALLALKAKFPIVCSNCDFDGTPCEGLIKKYIVIERDGIRIGVFGLTPKVEGLVMRENIEGVKYIDPIEASKEMVKTLREKEMCNVVVCLSHLGWGLGPEYMDDQQLVAATNGIDIVLGGHSHTYMKEMEWVKNVDGEGVPVDQNGKHGAFIGRITLTLEK